MLFRSFFISTLAVFVSAQKARVITHCSQPNTVALTLDDGPYIYNKEIVDLAERKGAKLTFFVNGDNWGCIYAQENVDSLQYAKSKGHQIASHTWAHKDLATLSSAQVHDEMWRVELALQRILGVNPAFMRPPYGSYNDNVLYASGVRNQTVVIWDFDSGDSAGVSASKSNSDYDNKGNAHPNNLLALNHETYETTAHNVLPHAIDKFKALGYSLVTVADCLGQQPYQWTIAPANRDGEWHC